MSSRRSSIGGRKNSVIESESTNIRVICRFRPDKIVDGKKYDGKEASKSVQTKSTESFQIDEENNRVLLLDTFEKKSYNFDKLFGTNSTQLEVFQEVKKTVESIMFGFNGTILACMFLFFRS